MKVLDTLLTAIALAALGSACVIETTVGPDDEMPGDSTSDGPKLRDVTPLRGGGFSGGPLDGVLTVFVQGNGLAPLEGASIVVDANGERLEAFTDENGRVDFESDALVSFVTIHASAPDRQIASVAGFDASVVTLHLPSSKVTAPTLRTGEVVGTIGGWDHLPPSNQRLARVAIVEPVGANVTLLPQAPRAGTVTPATPDGVPSNMVVNGVDPFPMWNDYRLELDVRTPVLALYAGTFDTETGETTLSHLGLRRAMNVATGTVAVEQDIEIAHALEQPVEMIAPTLPDLPNRNVTFGLFLSDEGIYVPVEGRAIDETTERQVLPLLIDELAADSYYVGLRLTSEDGLRTVESLRRSTDTTFEFDRILDPIGSPEAVERTLSATPVDGASLYRFEVHSSDGSEILWRAWIKGDATIALPMLPDVTDPLEGERTVTAAAIDHGPVNMNATSLRTLDQRYVSRAVTETELQF